MITPALLRSWTPSYLGRLADELMGLRNAMLYLSDDFAAGKPTDSWTFDSILDVLLAHQRLSDDLATQLSELQRIIEMLDWAEGEFRAAQTYLETAYDTANRWGLTIDGSTGAVSYPPRETGEGEIYLDDRPAQASLAADYIRQALELAETTDQRLAMSLDTAATTDVNRLGSLEVQRALLTFQRLSADEQVAYLLEHPEWFRDMSVYLSEEQLIQLGLGVADHLDDMADDPSLLRDAEWVDKSTALLKGLGRDTTVMATAYGEIGAEGLMATLGAIGSTMYTSPNIDGLSDLAIELRDGLGAATRSPQFDGTPFGEDLVRWVTQPGGLTYPIHNENDVAATSRIAILDFLLRSRDYGEDFVRGVAWELDEFDRSLPAELRGDYSQLDLSPSPFSSAVDGVHQVDPMARAIGHLGRHPGLGLEFFSAGVDADARLHHYLAVRDWSNDEFATIAQAGRRIGTDPANLENSPYETSMFVTNFLDELPENAHFDPSHAKAASEPIGALLRHYMPSVSHAVGTMMGDDDEIKPDDIHLNFITYEDYPRISYPDLDRLIGVAMSTSDGAARLAEGLAGLRHEEYTAVRASNPAYFESGVPSTETETQIKNTVHRYIGLEAYLQYVVGESEIAGAISDDQKIAAFSSMVNRATSLLPVPGAGAIGEVLGEAGKTVAKGIWNEARNLAVEEITESFATNEAATRIRMESKAYGTLADIKIGTVLALHQAGLLDVTTDPDGGPFMIGGSVARLEDIQDLGEQGVFDRAKDVEFVVDALGLAASEFDTVFKNAFTRPHAG